MKTLQSLLVAGALALTNCTSKETSEQSPPSALQRTLNTLRERLVSCGVPTSDGSKIVEYSKYLSLDGRGTHIYYDNIQDYFSVQSCLEKNKGVAWYESGTGCNTWEGLTADHLLKKDLTIIECRTLDLDIGERRINTLQECETYLREILQNFPCAEPPKKEPPKKQKGQEYQLFSR